MLMAVGARRSVSGPGAPSECRGPALCVGARRFSPALFLSGPGALRRGATLFVSGPGARSECRRPARRAGALCVGARRSLCRGGDQRCRGSASRPGAPLRRLSWKVPAICVSGPAGARRSIPKTSFSRYRRSVLGLALTVCLSRPCVSEPGALCVEAVLSVAVCVGARRSSSGLVCVGARRSVSRSRAPCVGARRSVSGPGGDRRSLCRGPALCIGLRRSLSGPGCVWSCSALSVSGPDALRRSLCAGARGSVSACTCCASGPRRSVSDPALFVSGAQRFVSGRNAFSECRSSLCRGPALLVGARRAI